MSGKLDELITAEVISLTSNTPHTLTISHHNRDINFNSSTMYPHIDDVLFTKNSTINVNTVSAKYKYAEDEIIKDFSEYLKSTYSEHYKTDDQTVECFDAWIALGDSMPTFRNTAIKYLWRYGKKGGSNKKDLLKALHYTLMCLYVDHYKKGD